MNQTHTIRVAERLLITLVYNGASKHVEGRLNLDANTHTHTVFAVSCCRYFRIDAKSWALAPLYNTTACRIKPKVSVTIRKVARTNKAMVHGKYSRIWDSRRRRRT